MINFKDFEEFIYCISPAETPLIGRRMHNTRLIGVRSGSSIRKRRRAVAKAMFKPSDKNRAKKYYEWV